MDQQLASDRVPAEIWLEIFELLPKSTDLHSISITCRKFHTLSIRALHRDVVWYRAAETALDLKVSDNNTGMEPAVRSLVLGVTRLPAGLSAGTIGLDGEPDYRGTIDVQSANRVMWGDIPAAGAEERLSLNVVDNSFASHELNVAMWNKIHKFTNISSLTFSNVFLLVEHFDLIHSLPSLRALSIDSCAIAVGSSPALSPPPSHTSLPITDLTLYNIRRATRAPIHHQHHQGTFDDLPYVLSLCTARGLRRLTIDPTADVFRCVFGAWDAQARGWLPPPQLEHLYVKKGIVSIERPSLLVGDAFPDTHLYHFCVQAKSLRTISTPIFVPAQVTILPEALPLSLERFCAPLHTAHLVAGVRRLKALGLLRCGVGTREGIVVLASVHEGLKMLYVELTGWDGEVLSAAAQLFKKLRRLKIVYDGPNGPGEVCAPCSQSEFGGTHFAVAEFPCIARARISGVPA